ncbi:MULTISPECIES: hypothetical protein, partial [unclassified Streptomyces]|uniref:hypothetical protein n=1 Tax=unclassified Streptomyces TaxID=2593676 RepID=UPI001C405035
LGLGIGVRDVPGRAVGGRLLVASVADSVRRGVRCRYDPGERGRGRVGNGLRRRGRRSLWRFRRRGAVTGRGD